MENLNKYYNHLSILPTYTYVSPTASLTLVNNTLTTLASKEAQKTTDMTSPRTQLTVVTTAESTVLSPGFPPRNQPPDLYLAPFTQPTNVSADNPTTKPSYADTNQSTNHSPYQPVKHPAILITNQSSFQVTTYPPHNPILPLPLPQSHPISQQNSSPFRHRKSIETPTTTRGLSPWELMRLAIQ